MAPGIPGSSARLPFTFPQVLTAGCASGWKATERPCDYGAPNGDLFIEMHVLTNKRFERMGDNLETTVEISPTLAVLGTTVEIETIDKRHIDLKIPANPGQHRARGLPARA